MHGRRDDAARRGVSRNYNTERAEQLEQGELLTYESLSAEGDEREKVCQQRYGKQGSSEARAGVATDLTEDNRRDRRGRGRVSAAVTKQPSWEAQLGVITDL